MDLNEAFQILAKNGFITISDKIELTNTEINKASKEYAAYRKEIATKLADKEDDTGEYMEFTDPEVAFRAGVKWALKRVNKKVL